MPILTIKIDREKTARYGVSVGDVQDTIAIAMGGQAAGVLFQGDRRFDIVVRLPEKLRSDMEALKRLPISLPRGQSGDGRTTYIPLAEVASLELAPGPNQISRENGKRRDSGNLQRAWTRHRFVRRRGARRFATCKSMPGILDEVRRAVRATAHRNQTPWTRRAGGIAAGLRFAVHDVWNFKRKCAAGL